MKYFKILSIFLIFGSSFFMPAQTAFLKRVKKAATAARRALKTERGTKLCKLIKDGNHDVEHHEKVRAIVFGTDDKNAKDVNHTLACGFSALHQAVEVNCKECTSLLCQRPDIAFDKKYRDFNDWTPLHYAAYLGHFRAAKVIIEEMNKKGENLFEVDTSGKTPLHIAADPLKVQTQGAKGLALKVVTIKDKDSGWEDDDLRKLNGKYQIAWCLILHGGTRATQLTFEKNFKNGTTLQVQPSHRAQSSIHKLEKLQRGCAPEDREILNRVIARYNDILSLLQNPAQVFEKREQSELGRSQQPNQTTLERAAQGLINNTLLKQVIDDELAQIHSSGSWDFYRRALQQLETNYTCCEVAQSGHFETRQDNTMSKAKQIARLIPFVGKALKDALEEKARKKVLDELKTQAQSILAIAESQVDFIEIFKGVIRRIALQYPSYICRHLQATSVPAPFSSDLTELQAACVKHDELATIIVRNINTAILHHGERIAARTKDNAIKAELILSVLLGNEYGDYPSTLQKIEALKKEGNAPAALKAASRGQRAQSLQIAAPPPGAQLLPGPRPAVHRASIGIEPVSAAQLSQTPPDIGNQQQLQQLLLQQQQQQQQMQMQMQMMQMMMQQMSPEQMQQMQHNFAQMQQQAPVAVTAVSRIVEIQDDESSGPGSERADSSESLNRSSESAGSDDGNSPPRRPPALAAKPPRPTSMAPGTAPRPHLKKPPRVAPRPVSVAGGSIGLPPPPPEITTLPPPPPLMLNNS